MLWIVRCFIFLCSCYSIPLCSELYKKDLRDKILQNAPPKWALEQIQADFSSIASADLTREALDSVMTDERFADLMLVRFQIVDGQVVTFLPTGAAKDSPRPGSFARAIAQILEVCKRGDIYIPDCDFYLTVHDGVCGGYSFLKAPVFCFSKQRNAPRSILVPDSEVLQEATSLQNEVAAGRRKYPWGAKKAMAFWRGITTGCFSMGKSYLESPRFQLVEVSMRNPDWIDARFSGLVQEAVSLGDVMKPYLGGFLPVRDHLQYKYQILIDGNTTAWQRAYWQLFSNCVIFKIHSDEIQWYYGGLQPFVHYIPAATDSHDLVAMLQWARQNDDTAYRISKNARKFAEENLHHADLLHYIYLVLCQYGQLQNQ